MTMQPASSTPNFAEFYPHVPYQARVLDDAWFNFDYGIGLHEILLSGSVGSAKSILMAHMAVRHCIENNGAKVLLGRKALPDLKETIYRKILEHLEGCFIEGVHYSTNTTQGGVKFRNGSEIISRSWGDKAYKKMRSLELSMAVIEELTENNDDDKAAFDEIKMRVGRLPHLKQNILIAASNPDSPGHWAYKYFELGKSDANRSPTKHVYYSVTTDNPFLPAQYVEQLRRDLDPQMARRMIFGEWIEIESEVVYYAYDKTRNRRSTYDVDQTLPIHLSWDFNIGDGKPLSLVAIQRDRMRDEFHIFNEVVIDGMRTEESCEEAAGRGILDHRTRYIVNGDASGKHRDTRNIKSDYEIIRAFLSNYRTKDGRAIDFEMQVPLANPPIRKRHNIVNAYCCNDAGQRRLFVYDTAPTADEGLRLTALKKGGQYIENDSMREQHITTAIGYSLVETLKRESIPEQGTRRL
jgi:hypothetical protein